MRPVWTSDVQWKPADSSRAWASRRCWKVTASCLHQKERPVKRRSTPTPAAQGLHFVISAHSRIADRLHGQQRRGASKAGVHLTPGRPSGSAAGKKTCGCSHLVEGPVTMRQEN